MDPDIDLSSIMVGYSDSPKQSTPVPELPIETPKQDVAVTPKTENKELATKIKLYFDIFSAKLKHIKPKNIDKLNEEELQDLHKQVNYILGAKTNVEGMAKSFPMLIKAIEDLAAQFTPLRIQGTHNTCYDPDVQDMIKYTIIDSGLAGLNSTPQQRLMFTLFSAAARQHAMNSAIESMTAEQKAAYYKAMGVNTAPATEPPPEQNNKYADL